MSITVNDIARWRPWRNRKEWDPKDLNRDAAHQLAHIVKALGPLAACAEHRDHNEPDIDFDSKRVADLVIHAIWLGECLGFPVGPLIERRIKSFEDGFSFTGWQAEGQEESA